MRCVVLAAGKGTRLSPLCETRPKPLIPIGGRPILEHLLLALRENDIHDVLVVVGYLAESIKSRFKDGSHLGIRVQYARQRRLLGTADALATSKNFVQKDDFLVVNGDMFVSPEAIRPLLDSDYVHENVIAIARVDNVEDYGVVLLKEDRVERLAEKPTGRMSSPWVNAGIYRMNETALDFLRDVPYSPRGELELTDVFNALINLDHRILAAKIDARDWMDIGRPHDLLEANERALEGIDRKIDGKLERGTHLHGPIILARGAKVRSGAYIEGPVYIGEESDIGPNCHLRPYTSLGRETRVGNACEIKNSNIFGQSHIGHLSYVGDSILGEGCNLGAGTVTANLRFDDSNVKVRIKSKLCDTGRRKFGVVMGDGVKTGVNVSTMPGIKIGHNSWIGPNATVTRDVEPNTLMIQRADYETSSIE